MTDHRLDYCATRSVVGRDAADRIFGRYTPPGFDIENPGDETAITAIVAEQDRCNSCPDRDQCERNDPSSAPSA